jgi:FRG domain-containing protein
MVRVSVYSLLDETIWPGTTVTSWDELAHLASGIAEMATAGRNILLRGQPHQWTLRPTLLRAVPQNITPEAAQRAERNALDHFRSQAHLHQQGLNLGSPDTTLGPLEWWALMQHDGAPTRLLDWTASPYVAAYFAVEQGPETDGAILVIDADALLGAWGRAFGDEGLQRGQFMGDPPAAIRAFTPAHKTIRLVTQQGYFTFASRLLDTHDQLLAVAGAIIGRWIVPAALKPTILTHLWTMNVAANSLFPGLDGLGRSAGELLRRARPT